MQSKKMSDLKYICQFCQSTGTNHKRCSRCQKVYYCTKECQKMDWSRHRLECKPQKKVDASDKGLTLETKCQDQKTAKVENANDTQKKQRSKPGHEEKREAICKGDLFQLHSDTHAKNANTDNDEKPLDDLFNAMNNASNQSKGTCNNCGVDGCVRRCSRCMKIFYCSKACQNKEWPIHKRICNKKMSEEDLRILKSYERKKKSVDESNELTDKYTIPMQLTNFRGSANRFKQMLTFEQAMMRATRPNGSLEIAKVKAIQRFPGFEILTKFSEVPGEDVLRFQLFFPLKSKYVLLAFMYRYHEHAMRHGVYLKDESDAESKVEFYLDRYNDNPMPYFSYKQVRPGGYIALIKPVIHFFADGTVGIRINHPHEVAIIDV